MQAATCQDPKDQPQLDFPGGPRTSFSGSLDERWREVSKRSHHLNKPWYMIDPESAWYLSSRVDDLYPLESQRLTLNSPKDAGTSKVCLWLAGRGRICFGLRCHRDPAANWPFPHHLGPDALGQPRCGRHLLDGLNPPVPWGGQMNQKVGGHMPYTTITPSKVYNEP